jgi:hypothetical protein
VKSRFQSLPFKCNLQRYTAPQWREKLQRIPVLSRQLQQLHIRVAGCGVSKGLIGHATHSLANVGPSLPVIDAWLPLVKSNSVGLCTLNQVDP